MMTKNTICLRYEKDAEAAARFDVETLPQSAMGPSTGLSGGPPLRHSEVLSFQIATDDQKETKHLWNAIVGHGGQGSARGWCKDRRGLA